MAKQNNKLTKKEARLQIKHALASLTILRSAIGKKKFNRRLEKAEKLLSSGLPKKEKVSKTEGPAPESSAS